MPWFPNPNGGAPIQSDTNPNPAGGSLGYYSDPGYSGPPPSGGGGATSPSAPGTTPPTQQQNPYQGGLEQFGAQTSGVTQQQLAQQKAEFDAQLQFARDQMQQLGIPQLQINQFIAQMQQQQFQAQLQLAQQAQAYSQAAQTAQLTGYFTPPAQVPSIAQYLGGGGGMTGGLGGTGGGGGGGLNSQQYPAGTVVRTSSNQFGVVNADGSITPGDAGNPQIYQAIQSGQGIMTVPDAQFSSAVTAGQQTSAGGGATGGAGAAGGAGGPQQTLAGALQQAQLSGMYNGSPTEQAREFNRQLALQQGQLGQQYLATASQLTGPQNTFQLSNYLRGAQGNPNVPTYLNALMNNQGMAAFQGTGSTPPTPQSAAGLIGQMGGYGGSGGAGQVQSGGPRGPNVPNYSGPGPSFATDVPTMPSGGGYGYVPDTSGGGASQAPAGGWRAPGGQSGQYTGPMPPGSLGGYNTMPSGGGSGYVPDTSGQGQSATPGWDYNQTLGTIRGIMGQGAQSLGPGSLERLNPDELAAFGSGLGQAGGSLPSFLQQYQQSRIGQQAAGTPTLA